MHRIYAKRSEPAVPRAREVIPSYSTAREWICVSTTSTWHMQQNIALVNHIARAWRTVDGGAISNHPTRARGLRVRAGGPDKKHELALCGSGITDKSTDKDGGGDSLQFVDLLLAPYP